MTTILYVLPVAERGGAEVILLNIVANLDRARFRPIVLVLEQGPFVAEVERLGVDVVVIPSGRVRSVVKAARAVAQIRDLIRRQSIDIVHTFNAKAHIYGGLAAMWARVRCLFHLHGVPRPSLTRDGVVSTLAVLISADSIVACSQYVADAFTRIWPRARHASVIYNGLAIDAQQTSDVARTVRSEFGIDDEAPLIVSACRLQRWKGPHVLVAAAARVLKARPDARVLIVGGSLFGLEPHYERELRDLVDRLGITRSVTLTGFRSDTHRLLAAADVVAHCSIEPDPFPTVIVEALTLGRAVVAADAGGPVEMIDDGVDGRLVPAGDVARLADAIIELLDDAPLRLRIGTAAARRAAARLQADRMVREFEHTYLSLLQPVAG
jgi:glycosyltransferase involved in cell wall biosynthesis